MFMRYLQWQADLISPSFCCVFVARRVTTAPENNHVPVIVAVIVVFILLILVFALFLFLWRWDKHVLHALCDNSAIQYSLIKKKFFKGAFKKRIYEDKLTVNQLVFFLRWLYFLINYTFEGTLFCNIISIFNGWFALRNSCDY